MTTNMDELNSSKKFLCVDAGQWEILKSVESDNDNLSWDLDSSDESDYEDDDEESDFEENDFDKGEDE